MSPAPNRFHQDISRNLEFMLLTWIRDHPIGVIYHAPFDVELTEHDVFQPDIIFVSEERKSILTDAGATGAPDFVVEILSPRTAKIDRGVKKKMYAQAGVRELWIIDPEARAIEVFDLQRDMDRLGAKFTESDSIQSSCFPGWEGSVSEIFRQ
jgi:Uma2 family endonuclease